METSDLPGATMWSKQECALFDRANRCNGMGRYKKALKLADKLLALVEDDPRKYSYVSGCRKAVALKGLRRRDLANKTFSLAFTQAMAAGELAIAAYVCNDWASMRPADEAARWIREAIRLCEQAETQGLGTPDDERVLSADRAHMLSKLARTGRIGCRRTRMIEAKEKLQGFAYGTHPRYKTAYLLACVWELELYDPLTVSQAWRALAAGKEAIRQRNYLMAAYAAIKFLL